MAANSSSRSATEISRVNLTRRLCCPFSLPAERSLRQRNWPNPPPDSYREFQTLRLSTLRRGPRRPRLPMCLSHKENQSCAQNHLPSKSGLRLTPATSDPSPLSAPGEL